MVNGVYYKEVDVAQQSTQIQINPADESIHLGQLTMRFLLTGDNSTGSIAMALS